MHIMMHKQDNSPVIGLYQNNLELDFCYNNQLAQVWHSIIIEGKTKKLPASCATFQTHQTTQAVQSDTIKQYEENQNKKPQKTKFC